MSDNL